MIDIATNMLEQCFAIIPVLIIVILVFEFIGSFFFGKK